MSKIDEEYEDAANWRAWAIGTPLRNGRFRVRRVVWGRLLARAEKREDETVVAACVMTRTYRAIRRRP